MRLIIFGPPGGGKGTQAKMLAEKFDLRHLSTGDLFRAALKGDTPIGKEAKRYMERGELVPDEVTWQIIREPLVELGLDGFILDGYPRTLPQAETLLNLIVTDRLPSPMVVSLEVPDEELVKRLSRRRMHKETGEIYHLDYNPPPPDLAPELLIHRKDDQPDVIKHRLEVYAAQTEPIKAYFGERGYLREIDGTGGIEEVFERATAALST
jgi:adenylate kinase